MDEQNKEFENEKTVQSTEKTVVEEATVHEGEYHYVRPESRLYEDAGYVPQNETTEMPRYYVPAEKSPKRRKSTQKAQTQSS